MTRLRSLTPLCACLGLNEEGDDPDPSMWSEAEWLAVIKLANEHLLGPALYECLRRRGWLLHIGEDARNYLMMLYRLNQRRNVVLRRQAEEAIGSLNRAGVIPILLKGSIVLFEGVGPRSYWALRMMRDLDFLVPGPLAEVSTLALQSVCYRILNKYPDGHHAIGDFGRPSDPGSLDLHTELVDPWYILPASELRANAATLNERGLQALIPSPTHRLLHHVLHAQVHHLGQFYRGDLKLNQLYEFALICEYYAASIDWAFISNRLAEFGLTRPWQSYLAAAHHLFGLPLPGGIEPDSAARSHVTRCLLQLDHVWLGRLLLPWGNLQAAMASHRMRALYGGNQRLSVQRARHAWQFLHRHSAQEVLHKFLRAG